MLLGDVPQLAMLLTLPVKEAIFPQPIQGENPRHMDIFYYFFPFFQLLFAPLLGQCALNCAAPMFSNSAKLLSGIWGHNQAL